MIKLLKILLGFVVVTNIVCLGASNNKKHPNLLLTHSDLPEIRINLNKYSLFTKSFESIKEKTDEAIENGIDVPIPKDAGGGYTHEQHKINYTNMYNAGLLYQLTSEKKYFNFIKEMLENYAELYPTLGIHPEGKKQTPGKLFWQTLNETVWLLHSIQAYDCIYNELSQSERQNLEENLFAPMAEFFIYDCKNKFESIHNHGTWMVAAVGMTGFVLNNKDYINKSIYGFDGSGKTGFLAQLQKLFSPDGFYSEGPYYARYALWPFFVFAESINNNIPELGIYKYRGSILKKALNSLLQLTYTNGEFIPINDALKEKSWLTPELIYALTYTYRNYEQDEKLLAIVSKHKNIPLDGAGLFLAKNMENLSTIPEFQWESINFSDGPDGDEGGIALLRNGDESDQLAVVLKYGAHGLSHGHFDKLNLIVYDNGRELLPDYGAARFLNIEQKFGGRYLPENESFAKQTIAHNTLIVDEKSQFNGKRKESDLHHSELYAVDYSSIEIQYVSAFENNAYMPNIRRSVILFNHNSFQKPIIIDVIKANSSVVHKYDLPYYYKGHFLSTNFDFETSTSEKKVLGKANGYQHLWNDAEGKSNGFTKFTWLNKTRFYTLSSYINKESNICFVSTGANDPQFNLRNEKAILFRTQDSTFNFISILEPHGKFDPIIERTTNPYSKILAIKEISNTNELDVYKFETNEDKFLLLINYTDSGKQSQHEFNFENKLIKWRGPISVKKL